MLSTDVETSVRINKFTKGIETFQQHKGSSLWTALGIEVIIHTCKTIIYDQKTFHEREKFDKARTPLSSCIMLVIFIIKHQRQWFLLNISKFDSISKENNPFVEYGDFNYKCTLGRTLFHVSVQSCIILFREYLYFMHSW